MTMGMGNSEPPPNIVDKQNDNQIEAKSQKIQVKEKNQFGFFILDLRAWFYRHRHLHRFLRWPYIDHFGTSVTCRIGPNTWIKSSPKVRLVEAQTMAFVRAHTSIPVPQIFEVLLDTDGRHYIVMEYIDASELTWVWTSLSEDKQQDIINQIGKWWTELRQIPSRGPAICALDGGPTLDNISRDFGPYPSFKDFATHYGYSVLRGKCDSSTEAMLDELLAKEHHIVFTHCDLAPRNILVKHGRIVAIIDWECAGWFPEYWEAIQIEYANGLEIPSFGKKLVKSVFPEVQNEQRLEYELVPCIVHEA
ncbi:kinase-like domain-containing protein [Lentinula raphanica]|nr:kinase-like domain-containing protein [Lentinula raphanica]